MTQLTDLQLAQHVIGGGFAGEDRVIGVAVALAESGGRSDAIGDVALETATWGPSVGLFQIRSLKADRGTGRTRDELANLDPATNAKHAHQVFLDAGGHWTPWSTFKNSQHLGFLDRARTAIGTVQTPVAPPGPAVGPAPLGPAPVPGAVHIVRPGETLSDIAQANGLTLAQLRALNAGLFDAAHHGGDMIQPGERVVLSAGPVPTPPPVPAPAPTHAPPAPRPAPPAVHTHVVKSGETLSGIAHLLGVTLARLRSLNPSLFDAAHHHGDLVHPGEVVRF